MLTKALSVFLIALLSQAKAQKNEGDSCVDQYTNTVGKCKSADTCESARSDFQLNGIRPTFCTYSAFGVTLVCCRDGVSILHTAEPITKPPIWGSSFPNRQSDGRRVSERNDYEITTAKPTVQDKIYQGLLNDIYQEEKEAPFTIKKESKVEPSFFSEKEMEFVSKVWWLKLRRLDDEQRNFAEKMINDILFYAGVKKLTIEHLNVFESAFRCDETKSKEIKCEEYSRGVVEKVDFIALLPVPETMSISAAKCDYTGVELIVGGENALQGEFPHMAAIGWANFNSSYDFKCGGSLISPRFVLTAGHCSRDPRAQVPEPVVVRLGDQNIDPTVQDGASPIEVPIKTIHNHPEYKPPRRYNDIALIELASDVNFDASIRPACLWAKQDFGGYNKALATGWGVTDTVTKKTSKELQKVSLSLLDNDYCDQLLVNNQNRNWEGFAPTQLCAGELRGGKDTCQGDSGSPLQVAQKDNQCIFHIIGITSFGRKCAETGRPAVYTRVANFLPWIESVVWPGE